MSARVTRSDGVPRGRQRASPARPARPAGRADLAITAALRITGAGLLIAAAALHLNLYLTSYDVSPGMW